MSKTIEELVKWKEDKNRLGMDRYTYFFNQLEDNYLFKSNGTEKNIVMITIYDLKKETIEYIIHQLLMINRDAGTELMDALKLEQPYLSSENRNHLEATLDRYFKKQG